MVFFLLLTGDLEKKQELSLVEHYKMQLKSPILQAPHHGSNASSTYAFLNAVDPDVIIISTSRYNAFHLPSQKR